MEDLKRVENPPNPYQRDQIEWIDASPPATLQLYEEHARSVLTENKSPDIGFRYSVNPYRGCFHGCAYCYARPSHQYLDFGAGTDFERKIVVKVNAPQLLDAELSTRYLSKRNRDTRSLESGEREQICFSGNTDCYQPLELSYQLTRRCLNVCFNRGVPVSIITKGAIIRRDIDLLKKLHERAGVEVNMSIAFSDDEIAKAIEPGAPRPSIRFRVLAELSRAGIPTHVVVAPIICGLNDSQIPHVLKRARDAGARGAFMTLLRLPREVKEIFFDRIFKALPLRAEKILAQVKEARGGSLNNSEFGKRMVGEGPRWQMVEWLFRSQCKALGIKCLGDFSDFGQNRSENSRSTFWNDFPFGPSAGRQLNLL